MRILLLPLTARFIAFTIVVVITAILLIALLAGYPPIFIAIPLVPFAALSVLGTMDLIQTRHSVLRNYPLTAHIRFILEEICPEIRQYFLESEKDGTPFSRDKRALVYQRAKRALDKRPFGTQNDVYLSGYEWLHHSIAPKHPAAEPFRVDDRRAGLRQALFGLHLQHFGDELWRSQSERHPLAQYRRPKGQLRPRHRRRRLQFLPSRKRRRPDLGNRLGLFQLPQRRRHVLPGKIRGRRADPTR